MLAIEIYNEYGTLARHNQLSGDVSLSAFMLNRARQYAYEYELKDHIFYSDIATKNIFNASFLNRKD